MGYQEKGLPRGKVVLHGKVRGQPESKTHQETAVEETLLEELVGIRDLQVKVGALPEGMVIKEGEGVMMMTQIPVMMEMGMIPPHPRTPLLQEREDIRVPNMFMYFKGLLGQKVRKVNPDKQEEMAEMGKISP